MHPRVGRTNAAWWLLLGLVAASCGGDDTGDEPTVLTDVCDDTNRCVCPDNELCDITCEATGDCDAACGAGSTCNVACAGTGACAIDCRTAASCGVDCAGVSNCDVNCPKSGCTVENCGEGCSVVCGLDQPATIEGTTAKCP